MRFTVFAVGFLLAFWVAPGNADSGYANVPLPTLGGRQLWTDARVANGWRVQEHVWTGHSRLLDPDDVRRCWGPLATCMAVMDELAPPLSERPLVVLVHGLGRSPVSMKAMVAPLLEAGFDVEAFHYASTRGSLDVQAAALAKVLTGLGSGDGARPVSFVTHSLGALVVRAVLADRQAAWRSVAVPQRAVFLAPPNKGSALAEALWPVPPFRWLLGGGVEATLPKVAQQLAVPDIPFAIVAAGQGTQDGVNPWLDGDDDGLVKVAETPLEGAAAWYQVDAVHTFIARSPEAIELTVGFLTDEPG